MEIAFFEVTEEEPEVIKRRLSGHDLKIYKEKLQDKIEEVKDFECVSVRIYSKLDKKTIDSLPNLKLIVTRSTGFDHIDLKAANDRGVTVCNVPRYAEDAVAEHVFALILALAKNIVPAVERTRKGDFSLVGLKGFELKAKTLGLVGCGNIGKSVARIAKGFGMKIIIYDLKEDKKFAKEVGAEYTSYEDLLARSDILSFHVPLTSKTRHMLNKTNIEKVKRGAILINTARGEVVDTEAVLLGLEKGIIRGAGLDVLEEECFIKEESQLLTEEFAKTCNLKALLEGHLLIKKENVIITPHSAFYSKEALERKIETSCQNILSFIKGKPENIVKYRN